MDEKIKIKKEDILKLGKELELEKLNLEDSEVKELLKKTEEAQKNILKQKKINENPSEYLLEQRIKI